jgi:hypothetical protein
MRLIRGLGYGETPMPDGGHSTIDLQEGHYVHVIVFVFEGHSINLKK